MIIIADSGSTKTTWCIVDPKNNTRKEVLTSGINPYYQNDQEILKKLQTEYTDDKAEIEALYFYGAGCTGQTANQIVLNALSRFFGAQTFEVESDLMGAARSLCGHQPGIACILGTGSNSCYYDGKKVVQHVSPLGFLLGDEASGAVMGKKLLADVLKNQLPPRVIEQFFEETHATPAEIMENIYRKPFPNRYAAGFSVFIYKHIHEPELKKLVSSEFNSFLKRNVLQYPQTMRYPVHFTGSIAWYFQDILKEVALSLNIKTGKIVKDPIEGLVDFHTSGQDLFPGAMPVQ